MEDVLLRNFHRLLTAHTGLHVRDKDYAQFRLTLASRMQELKLPQPEAYYQLLEQGTPQGEVEWKQLTARLTNGESYFFRDKGQLTLLRQTILPELIERNRSRRILRLWSAGCSTGEEPYSLAIVLHELLPHLSGWQLLILGTDINETALSKARQGVYNEWSFRMVEPELRQRYFHLGPQGYELDSQIRRMVTFRHGNLCRDAIPNPAVDIQNMDLILCRNVLIYFDSASITAVLRKFEAALAPGGYLVTGHAELNHQHLGELRTKRFPESVVYQRQPQAVNAPQHQPPPMPTVSHQPRPVTPPPETPRAKLQTPPLTIRPAPHPLVPKTGEALQEAKTLLSRGAYTLALDKLKDLLRQDAQNLAALTLAAQAYANLGQHEQAAGHCRQAIALDAFAPTPYHLLAHIVEEQGEADEAKNLLKKVIYLAPAFVAAYMDLGAIYQREGDHSRARQMLKTARELLQRMPSHEVVEACDGLTAATVMEHLQELA